MHTEMHERYKWAIALLNIQADDQVLEIGCGTGIMAEQIAMRLRSGRLHAIDKSPAQIQKAITRNQKYIQSGKAVFNTMALEAMDETERFDKITAFNVNVFLKPNPPALRLIRQMLKVNGKLFVFYQPPSEKSESLCETIKYALKAGSFETEKEMIRSMHPASAVCVTATANR